MAEKVLSVFVDESGDFGPYDHHAPTYLVAMVLHDQRIDILDNVRQLDEHLKNLGRPIHAIHTGPLIRRESVYASDLMEERKRLFNALFNFARRLDIRYVCAQVRKSECPDVLTMTAKLSRAIADVLGRNMAFFNEYDRIIVYYDNGQGELTKILTAVFNALFLHVEFRKVQPVNYKLFQVADLVCTMELLKQKADSNSFSNSEQNFFSGVRNFKKNYWKWLEKKKL